MPLPTNSVRDESEKVLQLYLARCDCEEISPAGRLLLNRRLVQAPVDAIDYVITHELCHVAEPHHGAAFFDLLDKVMPDWERRKQRLERAMA